MKLQLMEHLTSLDFVAQPYIWTYCQENDGHALHEVVMMEGLLNQLEYHKDYRLVGDYIVPANDFSRPVYELGRGRLSFPTYFMKERFVRTMLAKSDNESVR